MATRPAPAPTVAPDLEPDVSGDMERIFGTSDHKPAGQATRRRDPIRPLMHEAPAPARKWPVAVMIATLAGLLMAGGATWIALQWPLTTAHATRTSVAPVRQAVSRRLTPSPAPVAPTTPVAAEKPVAAAYLGPAAPPEAAARPSPQRAPPLTVQSDEARCDQPEGQKPARCYDAELATADEQLRAAYARAAGAGVSPRLLAMFRDRWWQLRRDAAPDPAYAATAYRQLTHELSTVRGSG